jgi:hypothetical protein
MLRTIEEYYEIDFMATILKIDLAERRIQVANL